jgi:chemotaxis protein methyltransferase CheR
MVSPVDQSASLEDIEVRLLLEGIYLHYGYDFRDYAPASLRRRLRTQMEALGVRTLSELQAKVLHEPECMNKLLVGLTVNVSAMFRDPGFFLVFRNKVVPVLRTYPFIRIWHAGCATGEEVYSMAILLAEEGLYDRCRVYATDIHEAALTRAREGIFPLGLMRDYTTNYIRAGGKRAFSEYYTAQYGNACFHPSLRQNVVFYQHNLATDSQFNTFHVIMCRNVMIYFNKTLQARAHALIFDSLLRLGFLGLGSNETVQFTGHEAAYELLDAQERLYRKTGP